MGPDCPHITEEETVLHESEHLALPSLMLEAGFSSFRPQSKYS